MQKSTSKAGKSLIALTIFGIAMGLLEAAVVVYLRQLYYPEGLTLPLKPASSTLLLIESSRELATLVMLITAAIAVGENALQSFAYFLYMFGIWDIFYYVFLKVFLDWPASILTWDVLFFVPVLWVSPVLAPIICSLTMIVFGCITVLLQQKGAHIKIKGVDWALFISGAAVIFYSFIKDYVTFLLSEGLPINIWALARNPNFQQLISQYVPTHYSWYLFFVGELLMLIGMFHVFRCAQPKR
ncbi:hypothetical protein [Coprothermobacter proteolyticus]|uniref:hypothetical protein n=2 Tax=Bacteria TaxID=2 RepID=UPI000D301FDE|nr:hypothetical protein [Coprothermobacter proteolyticus]